MFRNHIITLGLNLGVSIGRQVEKKPVVEFIQRLHPKVPEQSLIRLGGEGDGGYLVPDDLEGIEACFSPGVSSYAGFEADLIKRGIRCYLADASVPGAPFKDELLHFTPKFLGAFNDNQFFTLDDGWTAIRLETAIFLLQMDIEGAEWPVLLNVSTKTLRRFRIIVVELHGIERLMDSKMSDIIRSTFERLLDHFDIVHNHPNNYGGTVRLGSLVIPRVLEMTLLRKDRTRSNGYARKFPHPLDRANDTKIPDLLLPAEWYRS